MKRVYSDFRTRTFFSSVSGFNETICGAYGSSVKTRLKG